MSKQGKSIPDSIVQEVKDRMDLADVVRARVSMTKKGREEVGQCPSCGKEKGLKLQEKKGLYKCFHCDWGGKNPITFLMEGFGLDYPAAITEIGGLYGIAPSPSLPEPQTDGELHTPKMKPRKSEDPFVVQQLEGSGLTLDDASGELPDPDEPGKLVERDRYTPGTMDRRFNQLSGDDMLLHYYGLDGKPITDCPKGRTRPVPYIRVRWSNPENHLDKNGKSKKYEQPYGTRNHIWLPNALIRKYAAGGQFTTLVLTEGEKKADKLAKHGVMAVGVSGINNLVNKNEGLPDELSWIIKKCGVSNVVLLFDADWQDLKAKPGKPVVTRPKSFYRAAERFQAHFKALNGRLEEPVDLYLGSHVTKLEAKGIDDLMVTEAKYCDRVAMDLKKTIADPNGKGEHLQLYKILSWSEHKLMELWGLQKKEAFFERYREELLKLEEFVYEREKFIVQGNAIKPAKQIKVGDRFWEEKTRQNGEPLPGQYRVVPERFYGFLENRNYFSYRKLNNEFSFIRVVENTMIEEVDPIAMKHDLKALFKEIDEHTGSRVLANNHKHLFEEKNLTFLTPKPIQFLRSGHDTQFFIFEDSYWKITPDEVKEGKLSSLPGYIWREARKPFKAQMLPTIVDVDVSDADNPRLVLADNKKDGQYLFELCEFLDFLFCTSNFWWHEKSKEVDGELTYPKRDWKRQDLFDAQQEEDMQRHVLSKLSAIGYLLHKYRFSDLNKAIMAGDGADVAMGESAGGSGKSLLGHAVDKVATTNFVNGKFLHKDRYPFGDVDEKTDVVWIDDLSVYYKFDELYPQITGKFIAENKHTKKVTIPFEDNPKLYITMNHGMRDQNPSTLRRQHWIVFSNFFNEQHTPADYYGKQLFQDWDNEQWQLFYRLMADCVRIYLKARLIDAPNALVKKRSARAEIGETLLGLFQKWFFPGSPWLNKRIEKNAFHEFVRDQKQLTGREKQSLNISFFKKKVKAFCTYEGFQFNPHKGGEDCKSNGKEYFIIADDTMVLPVQTANIPVIDEDDLRNGPDSEKEMPY